MHKKFISVVFFFFAAALVAHNAPPDLPPNILITDLAVGRMHRDAGAVGVWNDNDYLYVQFSAISSVFIDESHVHAADSLEGIPQTIGGNAIPGLFDYGTYHDPWVYKVGYAIPLDPAWVNGTELYIAAHAVLYKRCGVSGTAWGLGYDFPGDDWSMYIKYTVSGIGFQTGNKKVRILGGTNPWG